MPELLPRAAAELRRLPPHLVDVVIGGVVVVATVGAVLVSTRRAWWVIALACLASAPVVWRRRAPIVVFCIVGLATTSLASVDAMPTLLPYGTLVCLYTIAALSRPLWRRLSIAVTGMGVLISLVVPQAGLESYGYAAMSVITAWALGTAERARRAQIAALKERGRRLEEERGRAAEQERVRIVSDLHDIVTHAVGLMVVQAETGAVVVRADTGRAEKVFDTIADIGRDAVAQLRRIVGASRCEGGDLLHQPGIETLPDLIERSQQAGLNVHFAQYGRPRPVPAEVAVATYRIVQEALTNALRHAAAEVVKVSLNWSDEAVTVKVIDDGRGWAGGNGHGLIGMAERATACGGSLRTGPGPDGGFAVIASLPLG